MTCSERFNIYSEGSLSQLWNTVGRENLVYYVNQTLIHKNCKLILRLSDFVRKRFYNLSRGLPISALKQCRQIKFRTHIHLTLVSKIY